MRKRFESNIDKYTEEKKEIQDEAHKLEAELAHETQRANRFDLGEVFLEIRWSSPRSPFSRDASITGCWE